MLTKGGCSAYGQTVFMNKKSYIRIIAILSAVFVALWGICNLSSLFAAFKTVLTILVPIIAGGCIAFALNIPMRFLERLWIKLFTNKFKWLRRTVCIILCLLILAGLILLLVGLVVPQIWRTAQGIFDKIPEYIGQINGWYESIITFLKKFSLELPKINIKADSIMEKLRSIISDNSHHIIDTSVGIVTGVFSGVVDTIFAIVIAVYILAQKERLGVGAKKLLYSVFSEKTTERILAFSRLSEKTFSSFITGQLTEAIILGLLCFIGMVVFNIPYAALVSVLIGVTALIPIFGAFIGAATGAFLILFESPIKAIIFLVFILVLQQIEGNVIYPRVVGSQVGLPGLWVLVAVSIGAEFGVFGMLISVPVVSLIYALVRQFADARIKAKGLEADFPDDEPKRRLKKPKRSKRSKKKKDRDDVEATEKADVEEKNE